MNDELQQQLAAFLAAMLDAVKSGGEWAAGQMPLLVQEKIQYAIVTNGVILAAVTLTLIAAGLALRSRAYRRFVAGEGCKLDDYGNLRDVDGCRADIGDRKAVRVAAWCAWAVVGGVVWLTAFTALLKPLIAPRLYIIEWLTGLLSQGG